MVRKFNKLIAGILATVLFTALLAGTKLQPQSVVAAEINGCTLTASNSKYNLYVNEETLSLVVEDKKTGAYMESSPSYDDEKSNKTWWGAMNSPVVITMISGSDDTKQAEMMFDKVNKKVTYTENGFVAEIYWTKYKFGVTLEVSLSEDGLVVRVPDESIREDDTGKYMIGTIALYPYMGVSYLDSKEGYMLVPDGNGALIYLNDKEGRYNSGFSYMIYGSDIGFDELKVESLLWGKHKIINGSEQILAPVFGIAHTDDKIAYLAIVEDGAMRAEINCVPNGVSVDYNRAFARFIERKLYTQPTSNNSTAGSLHLTEADRSHSDLQVRYIFLSDDQANYSGMAGAYREYLTGNGQLKADGSSYNTRVDFLGSDREEWVIGTSAVVMTTVEDIRGIYADLKARGVSDIISVYKGWQKGGVFRLPITKYKSEKKLGSTADLTGLMKDAGAEGIDLYLYDEALRINPDEFSTVFNVVKKINKRKYEEATHKDVYNSFNYVTPQKAKENMSGLTKAMLAKGADNLCIAGITNALYSYSYSGTAYTRYDTGKAYADAVSELDESMNLVLEQPFAYLWKNTKAFLDMPLYTSSYIYEDTFVPFLSLVLKGVMPQYSEYVNFEANKREFFLKMIEAGVYPSFYITKESSSELIYTNSSDIYSSQYSAYEETIESYSKELSEIAGYVEGAFITGHTIDGTLRTVEYSNGIKIYINYGETAVNAGGSELEPMSYRIVR